MTLYGLDAVACKRLALTASNRLFGAEAKKITPRSLPSDAICKQTSRNFFCNALMIDATNQGARKALAESFTVTHTMWQNFDSKEEEEKESAEQPSLRDICTSTGFCIDDINDDHS